LTAAHISSKPTAARLQKAITKPENLHASTMKSAAYSALGAASNRRGELIDRLELSLNAWSLTYLDGYLSPPESGVAGWAFRDSLQLKTIT
jgi:hypothetical protein